MALTDRLSRSELSAQRATDRCAVAIWLFICCAMIIVMLVIGGITRLTESGLSITEWQPIGGAVPPLSAGEWRTLFEQYRATPQYAELNQGMSLAGFQTIFWWEYVHRLWGRLIGVAFLLPLVWFVLHGRIARPLILPLVGLFLLGGLQGAVGWWMVASGLDQGPFVSAYRLTVHLGFALALMVLLQFALGLSTLLMQVPLPLAVMHQAGAALLLTAALVLAERLVQRRASFAA